LCSATIYDGEIKLIVYKNVCKTGAGTTQTLKVSCTLPPPDFFASVDYMAVVLGFNNITACHVFYCGVSGRLVLLLLIDRLID